MVSRSVLSERSPERDTKPLVSPVQLSGDQVAELREAVGSLQQEKEELQYNTSLLEEDNQTLREEIQRLRGQRESLWCEAAFRHWSGISFVITLLMVKDSLGRQSLVNTPKQKAYESQPMACEIDIMTLSALQYHTVWLSNIEWENV